MPNWHPPEANRVIRNPVNSCNAVILSKNHGTNEWKMEGRCQYDTNLTRIGLNTYDPCRIMLKYSSRRIRLSSLPSGES